MSDLILVNGNIARRNKDNTFTGSNTFENTVYVNDDVDITGTYRVNGVPIGGGPGGSQTPWTSDIDADGYELNNVSRITTTDSNTFIGTDTGIANTTGTNNFFGGYQAGFSNTDGTRNLAIGYRAGYSNQSGEKNTYIGYRAGDVHVTGTNNFFLGADAGDSFISGGENVFLGDNAAWNMTGGEENVLIGHSVGGNIPYGRENTLIGSQASEDMGYADRIVAIGFESSNYFTAQNGSITAFADYVPNTGVETQITSAGHPFTGGEIIRIIGTTNYNGEWTVTTVADGDNFTITTAFVADDATGNWYRTDQGFNTAIGVFAGRGNNGGYNGSYNTFLGYGSGYSIGSGSNNNFIGYQAGYSNETGTGNIFIGYQAGYNETGSSKLYIENSNSITPLIYGDFDIDRVQVNGSLLITTPSDSMLSYNDGDSRFFMGVDAYNNAIIDLQAGKTGFSSGDAVVIDFTTSDDADYDFRLILGKEGSTYGKQLSFVGDSPIRFRTASEDYTDSDLFIGTDHNVGIGTGAPDEKLTIDGNLFLAGDGNIALLGGGKDMSIDYDGTQGNIKTDLVAASDLHIDCGTDKTLVLDETVWNDLPPMMMLAARVGGANNPTLTTLAGNIQQLTFAVNDYVYANSEILHDYKEGTDIELHVHIVTQGSDNADRFIRYEVEYWIVNIDGSSTTLTGTCDQEFTIPANTADRTHLYFDFDEETITGTNINIGAYLCVRFKRLTAVGTAPTSSPFVMALGAHYEIDTLGSREEHAK